MALKQLAVLLTIWVKTVLLKYLLGEVFSDTAGDDALLDELKSQGNAT